MTPDSPHSVLVTPGAPVGVVKAAVLTRVDYRVSDAGEHVHVTVGGHALPPMPYEAALSFAALVRLHAKRAKRAAGDTSRNWRALALLEDASGGR